MTLTQKLVRHLIMLLLPNILFLFGCSSSLQDPPLLPDAGLIPRTPILLTSEARAEATNNASDKPIEGFGGRKEAEQEPTADAVIEAQLTRAPTVAAFLTRLATTPIAEGTPSPPSGCPGGCTTYPTWCEPPIKGNTSDDRGERIYYMPDDEFYDEIQIETNKGDYYFCIPEEAEAAGWQRVAAGRYIGEE